MPPACKWTLLNEQNFPVAHQAVLYVWLSVNVKATKQYFAVALFFNAVENGLRFWLSVDQWNP